MFVPVQTLLVVFLSDPSLDIIEAVITSMSFVVEYFYHQLVLLSQIDNVYEEFGFIISAACFRFGVQGVPPTDLSVSFSFSSLIWVDHFENENCTVFDHLNIDADVYINDSKLPYRRGGSPSQFSYEGVLPAT